MTDNRQEPDNAHSKKVPKLHVHVPEDREKTLQRIFGTSQVFYSADKKPRIGGSTVPVKVREYYHQGHQSLEHEDWETAVLFFSRALHLNPDLADFYVFRAEAFLQLCDFSSALQNLRRAYSYEPENSKYQERLAFVLYLQGQCLYELCDFQEALYVFLQASDLQPQNSSFSYRWGTMYRRLQQFDPAVEDFLKVLDMVTDSQDSLVEKAQRQLLLTYNDFAVHCYTQGAYQEGVLLLNKAIRDEQNEKSLYINRGDCFFQLGNLAFAEADYKQALALSPQDEGANLRMGVLQEKMGFCEQTRRQFQTAEDHFSTAIKHNPEKAQYYLHRAKSRQLLQNILGARQDVATVLLLNPNYPKMVPLMTNLFPGMTVEDVLKSQVAELAKLQLSRMLESGPKARHPQSIVVQRLMERQKARALMESWNREYSFTENLEEELVTSQTSQVKTELKRRGADKKVKPHKVTSLTDSYVDQTSSGSVFSILSLSTSGIEPSDSQEYRSTSNTAVMSPQHSRPQSSDPRKNRENLGLSRAPKVTQASENLNQNLLETTPAYGQRRHSNKAEATQSPKPKPRKTEPPQRPGRQGPRQKSGVTEATEGPKPRKKRPALTPKQRLRRAKAIRAQSWKPKSQGHSQKPTKTSSETVSHGGSGTNSSETQDRSSGPSSSEDTSSSSESASSSSKTDEPSLQDPQDGDLSSSKAELSPTPSQSAVP
uniref:tetratricopeptide repeat protein 16 isoform X4 n=1 Tax=Myodes glareolus TaxID=447135 RepID=UPI00202054C3|nr:tetratricopeptide repeat protein 16 isoform X4 [Myodes glareolus]